MNENKNRLAKVTDKRTVSRKTKKTPSVAPQKLKLLFTIVNRSKAEFYMDLLQSYDINMQISVYGNDERILLVSRYDNLGKGASGAAIECLNLVLGTEPYLGLEI